MQRFHHLSSQTLLMLIKDTQHEINQDDITTKDENPGQSAEETKY